MRSIPVGVRLEWTSHLDTNVVRLFLRELRQLSAKRWQMQACNLLVQLLGQQVYIILVGLGLLPVLQEVQLGQDLICERARHNEGWMSCGATQVAKTPGC